MTFFCRRRIWRSGAAMLGADNPAVAGDPRVRFYAGVPLAPAGGHCVGTLCIMDHRPRLLNEPQLERLRELGRMVEAELAATSDAAPADQ